MMCEDYPCCGHESGDCPNHEWEDGGYFPFRCVECGGKVKLGDEYPNVPSMHYDCATRMADEEAW